MSNRSQHSVLPLTRGGLARAAAFALLAGSAFFNLGSSPASAQSTGWERACAERMVSPGAGDALRVNNCARQRECQAMANAKGAMMMEMGCFFVSPSASAPMAEAGRSRPAQQH